MASPNYYQVISLILLAFYITGILSKSAGRFANEEEIPPAFWEHLARDRLIRTNSIFGAPKGRAKNVILFLGDGMGLPTIAAARFFKTEVEGRLGATNPSLYFEEWPFHTLCRTFDLSTSVTDSAASSTAYLCGTKTKTGMLGLTGAVDYRTCREYKPEERLESVLRAAAKAGMATGIVTTSRITHASPAGAYAHISKRSWEYDSKVVQTCRNSSMRPKDIARQLVEENLYINVLLGGGLYGFIPETENGGRIDGRNLTEEWLNNQTRLGRRAKLLLNPKEFMKTDFSNIDYVFGLMNESHLPYDSDRPKDEPSLANMTTRAIEILSRHPNGFFLFVEGARIDHGHHDNYGKKALFDALAFEEAVRAGIQMVNLGETLAIVTADHSHSFSLVAQPSRNATLFELDEVYSNHTLDKKGMLPINYISGPGGYVNISRINLNTISRSQLQSLDFRHPAHIPLPWASHGGEDVSVYATGVFSHLFHSTVDNTFVAQAMKYALCLRPFEVEAHCTACRFIPALLPLLISFLISRVALL